MTKIKGFIGVGIILALLTALAAFGASARPANASVKVVAHVQTVQSTATETDFCVGGATFTFPKPQWPGNFPQNLYGFGLYLAALTHYNSEVALYDWAADHHVSGFHDPLLDMWITGPVTKGACPTPPATPGPAPYVAPISSAPYCVSSNTWEAQPDFVLTNDKDYVVDGYFLSGYRSPYAVLTSSLPASIQNTRVLQNTAGPYTMLCNLSIGTTTLVPTPNSAVDQNGVSVPWQSPWIQQGTNLPQAGIMQVATVKS